MLPNVTFGKLVGVPGEPVVMMIGRDTEDHINVFLRMEQLAYLGNAIMQHVERHGLE